MKQISNFLLIIGGWGQQVWGGGHQAPQGKGAFLFVFFVVGEVGNQV
jgi:hypothetical protein